jgi:hypothetical protein
VQGVCHGIRGPLAPMGARTGRYSRELTTVIVAVTFMLSSVAWLPKRMQNASKHYKTSVQSSMRCRSKPLKSARRLPLKLSAPAEIASASAVPSSRRSRRNVVVDAWPGTGRCRLPRVPFRSPAPARPGARRRRAPEYLSLLPSLAIRAMPYLPRGVSATIARPRTRQKTRRAVRDGR